MVIDQRLQNTENICPVCGYAMDESPSNFNICPSCGTEFGWHTANARISDLRANWLRNGAKWWSVSDPTPEPWDPYGQLIRANLATDIPWLNGISVTMTTTLTFVEHRAIKPAEADFETELVA